MDVFWFQSFNFPEFYIRHLNYLGELSREVVGKKIEFEFKLIVRGYEDPQRRLRPLVSLGSVIPKNLFLRHRDSRLRLEGPTGTSDQLFNQDSTFFLERGLAAPNDPNAVSFRSTNYPDRYIRHRDFHLFVEPQDSANLTLDATFIKTIGID